MGLNANNIKGNNNRPKAEPLDADVYRARLVQVFDLGLQPQRPFQGQEKAPCQEVMLTYELSDEFLKDEEGNDIEDKPRWISETLPFYGLFADKAKSTKRYAVFDPLGAFGGDFAKCVGTPVNLTVVNSTSGDIVYNNVGNVAAMSPKKAATCPDLVNKPKVFDLDNPDMEVFKAMPQWLQEKIRGNLNFQGSVLQEKLGGKEQPAKEEKVAQEDNNNPY